MSKHLKYMKGLLGGARQQINFHKLIFQFGHKVKELSRQEIQDILGI